MKKFISLGKCVFPLFLLIVLTISCSKSTDVIVSPTPPGGGGPTGTDAVVTFEKVDSIYLGGDMKFKYSIVNCDYASYNGKQLSMIGTITVPGISTPEAEVTIKAKGTNGVTKDFSKKGYTYPQQMGTLCQTDPGKYWAIDSLYKTTASDVFIATIPLGSECWRKRPSVFKPYTNFTGVFGADGTYDVPNVCGPNTGGHSYWGFSPDYSKMYWGSVAGDGSPFWYKLESLQPHRIALSTPTLENGVPDGTKTWIIVKW